METTYPDKLSPDHYEKIFVDIRAELARAKTRFPHSLHSVHEGYAIILEEMEEFWSEIKKYPAHSDLVKVRAEAIQSAAMIIRFVNDLIDNPSLWTK